MDCVFYTYTHHYDPQENFRLVITETVSRTWKNYYALLLLMQWKQSMEENSFCFKSNKAPFAKIGLNIDEL